MEPGTILAIILGVLLFCLGSAVIALLSFTAGLVFLVRPWDGSTTRDHRWSTASPYVTFWLGTWLIWAAEKIVALKPGTWRAAELATAFIQSQVLFTLVNLEIPDLLCKGPRTAVELAADIGPAVNLDWLDRLLAAAHTMGMLNRIKGKSTTPQELLARDTCDTDTGVLDVEGGQDQDHKHRQGRSQHKLQSMASADQYSLNGVSAVLTSESPVRMSSFVKLFNDQYPGFQCLAQGIATNIVPFEVYTGGQPFWERISSSERHAKVFDTAMLEVNQIGGSAVVAAWPWHKYELVIDVAGGMGGFMADILTANPKLRGIVMDQSQQIDRAHKLWSGTHSSLAPRVQLIAGDMFDAATIPTPPEDCQGKVAYTLRNIVHDWSDDDSRAILVAIRQRISAADVTSGRVRLLLVEISTAEEVMRPCMLFRRISDMNMLMSFGDGKERSKQQFEVLLAAAGFKLITIKPTNGMFLVLEAVPV